MMDLVLETMDLVFKMMDFVFKMMNFTTSKVTSKFTAGFSLTRDIAHVVEMARALEGKGLPAGDLGE